MDEVGWASDSKYKYYLYRLPLVFATQPFPTTPEAKINSIDK